MPQPSLNPVELSPMVCIECSTVMRPVVTSIGRGSKPKKLDKIVYHCDVCKYAIDVTKQHVNGVNAPYVEPPQTRAAIVPLAQEGKP